MKARVVTIAALLLSWAVAPLAHANEAHQTESASPVTQQMPDPDSSMSEGEVRKVDKSLGKITIRHGELKNLDMPPMTMVFQVNDKSVLETVKAGDRISFVADKVDGKFTVMQMEVKQ